MRKTSRAITPPFLCHAFSVLRMIVRMTAAAIVVVVMRMPAAAFVMIVMHMRIGLLVNAVYFYCGIIVHMQTLAAVIANFKRIKIAEFALAAAYTIAVV